VSLFINHLLCQLGPEEPWYRLTLERDGWERCANARERALAVAGRAAWLSGALAVSGPSVVTSAFRSEALDCREAAEAWRNEAGSGRVS
jgi:hypothetical protein